MKLRSYYADGGMTVASITHDVDGESGKQVMHICNDFIISTIVTMMLTVRASIAVITGIASISARLLTVDRQLRQHSSIQTTQMHLPLLLLPLSICQDCHLIAIIILSPAS